MRPRDTSPVAHEVQMNTYRRMSGEQRLRLGLELSDSVREISKAGIRARHPDYTEDEVHHVALRLFLGDTILNNPNLTC